MSDLGNYTKKGGNPSSEFYVLQLLSEIAAAIQKLNDKLKTL